MKQRGGYYSLVNGFSKHLSDYVLAGRSSGLGGLAMHTPDRTRAPEWHSSLPHERRRAIRFPIRMDTTHCVKDRAPDWVTGQTINISSSGILIATDSIATLGCTVQVIVAWPRLLDDRIPLKLVALGRVVRCGGGQLAATLVRFEFRTTRKTTCSADRVAVEIACPA